MTLLDPPTLSPGLEAFGSLRAEDEPWLKDCIVEPANLGRLMNNRSVIIFGGIGAGKTTLYELLKRHNLSPDGSPLRLLVDWRVATPSRSGETTIEQVVQQVKHLYDLCAIELAEFLVKYPDRYKGAPDYAQERIDWFIHTYLQNAPRLRLGRLINQESAGALLLQQLLESEPVQILYPDAAPEQALDELSLALECLGLEGIWIMADDIERLAQIDEESLLENLRAIFATLPLFERSEFAFKLFVPKRLEAAVSSSSGIVRRRIDAVHLQWTTADLVKIVTKRLQMATNDPSFSLEKLCKSPKLIKWLEIAGGTSPRHWLDQLQPLIEHYVRQELSEPIDEKTWKEIRTHYPPRFYMYEEERRVVVGGREITLDQIPAKAFDILTYLYDRGNQIVPKDELYYQAYLGGTSVPQPSEERYEARDVWEGVVDTNIWRLRGAIEPEPKKPVLLETKRGQGLLLHVRW